MDSSPSNNAAPVAELEFVIQEQVVLILCGLIASGKSTFANALQDHFSQFRRCNQDDLGDRRRVEQLVRASLSEGQSVCVDRTNFNASQRSYWIDIAHEFPGTKIWVIVFDTPYDECATRLQTRQNHPTIADPEQGLAVLSRFAADFQHPSPHEGYQRILYVKPEDTTLNYTRPDIAAILKRVRDSPPIDSSGIPHTERQRWRQNPAHRGNVNGNRGYRGRRGDARYLHYAQGRRSLNLAPPFVTNDRSNANRGRRVGEQGVVRSSRGVSTLGNGASSSEIGGSGAMLDPSGVD